MLTDIKHFERLNGKLVKFTSVGCYPIFYVTNTQECCCCKCANEIDEDKDDDRKIIACDANWEDPEMFCDLCDERIESAYSED